MGNGPSTVSVAAADRCHITVHVFPGEGPTLLLAHATGFHGRVWEPVADQLADDFSCLAPDLRGHGDSAAPAGSDFDWRGFALDILAVVDGLGLPRPLAAAGHSSGATGLLLAEQARPGTFAALYCFEPIIVPEDPPLGRDRDSWLAEITRRRRAVFPSRAEALRHYARKPPLADLDPAALTAYVNHGFEEHEGGVRLKCSPGHEALVYEMATANDCFAHLAEVRCPVTLARGRHSEAFTALRADAIAARLPLVHTEEFPDLGHLGPLEDPRTVASSIRLALAPRRASFRRGRAGA